MNTIAVIGAGASGLMAAYTAAQNNEAVLLFEKNKEAGKKLNATGNGKGNIANRLMGPEFYHSSDNARLYTLIDKTDKEAILDTFSRMGILFHERNGYIYPRTDLAATLTDAFLQCLKEKSVTFHFGEAVKDVKKNGEKFLIYTQEHAYAADKVILAGGGLAGPQFGASKDIFHIASELGHSITDLYPALTFLVTDNEHLKYSAGVRAHAGVYLYPGEGSRELLASTEGEVQFNKNNLSGIPVFQISRYASMLTANNIKPYLIIDLLPEIDAAYWTKIMQAKMEEQRNRNILEWLEGLIHPKLIAFVAAECSLAAETKIRKLPPEIRMKILKTLRRLTFHITGTGNYKDAQVTAGGISLSEITDTYESRLVKGLFLVGEMLDVDGICGGYNLTFAMSSGRTAAIAAAEMRNL